MPEMLLIAPRSLTTPLALLAAGTKKIKVTLWARLSALIYVHGTFFDKQNVAVRG